MPRERVLRKMNEAQRIAAKADCPKCGSAKGTPCRAWLTIAGLSKPGQNVEYVHGARKRKAGEEHNG